jgi:uncharacterized protein (TIGR03437 family)
MKLLLLAVPAVTLAQGISTQVAAQAPPPSSELLRNAGGANDAFAAVARFRGALTCTGSLIDPSDSGADSAKAWLLTAGHCISLEPYGVIRNQPLTAQVQFNYFVDSPDRRVTVRSRSTGWSTMKGTDLALVELDATLGDLRAQGIRPLRLAATVAVAGSPIFWTGISGSPIPSELQFVRLGNCTLGRRVHVLEGSWIWNDEISNNCPDLYGGASGSPLFDATSKEIIGVIGTSTLLNFETGPDYDCQVNRPCVMLAGGPVMERDTSYASAVHGIGQCFDQANEFDIHRPGCPLDPGFQLTIQSSPNEVRPEVDSKPASWNATLSGSQRYYAYKHFPVGEGDCGSLSDYSAPLSVADAPVIADRVGSEDGYYLLCVLAGDTPSFDSAWQRPAYASVRFKRLDSQPPLVPVDYKIDQLVDAYRLTNLTGGDGTSGLGLAYVKRGAPSATDCSDPANYRIQVSIPDVVRTSDFPTRICWLISDKAGNISEPAVFNFGPPVILPNGIRNAASLKGPIAAGSIIRVNTFNLTGGSEFSSTPVATLAGVRMWVVDPTGSRSWVPMTTAGPLYLEAVMPNTVAAGPATLVVQPPQGPMLSQPVSVRPTAPGLYGDSGTGAPQGYAWDDQGNLFQFLTCPGLAGCGITQLPLSATPGGLNFVIYGTGFRAGSGFVKLRLGTHVLDSIDVHPHPGIAGLDEVSFHLPQDYPLHLYQTVAVETPDGSSNSLWIYLK